MALAVLYVALPYGRLAAIIYPVATVVAAAGIAAAAYRRQRLFRPVAWMLVAGALVLAAIGHGIWYWLELSGLEPFPSSADIFYLAVYPLFMAALWVLRCRSDRDDGALSDALIVGTSAAVIGWALLIAPYMNDPNLSLSQLLVSTAYPVADLILLPLVLRLVFLQQTRILAHLFLLLGMLAYLTADLLYAHGNLVGWYAPGGLTDGLWLVAYALFAAAAWHPSAALEPFVHASNVELSRRRLLVLGVTSVLVPAMILLTAERDTEIVQVGAIATIVLLLLVMHRMDGLLKETHRQSDALERLTRLDPLTGAANRRQLSKDLAREMARAERTGAPLGLAFLDLDHFKQFNDTHGHWAGDALLQDLVTAWREGMRPSDVLARFGGEEFVVVLPDTGMEAGSQAIERLRRRLPQNQTCSAGLAVFRSGESADSLIHRADQALYAAKDTGRDRLVCA
ncbi:GGDEF domain-containing protein [Fodinicurvata halophila]|uniref:diguanylate cyclase n=1 Tax=Fodinicurvata halophila TaxID=1419723 RepID=A0ABV8UN80_9PROT